MPMGKLIRIPRKKQTKLNKTIKSVARKQFYALSETKCFEAIMNENNIIESDVDAAVVRTSLNTLVEGAGPSQRIGNKVHAIGFKLNAQIDASALGEGWFRVILYKAPAGQFTAITDLFLLDTNGEALAPTAGLTQDLGRRTNPKLKILMDRTYSVDTANKASIFTIKKYFKLNDNLTFDDDASDDSSRNNIRMYLIARQPSNGVVAGKDVVMQGSTFFYYKDL